MEWIHQTTQEVTHVEPVPQGFHRCLRWLLRLPLAYFATNSLSFWFRKKAAALSRLETGIDCAVGAKNSKRLCIEQKCQVKPRKVRVLREDSRQNCAFSADGRGGRVVRTQSDQRVLFSFWKSLEIILSQTRSTAKPIFSYTLQRTHQERQDPCPHGRARYPFLWHSFPLSLLINLFTRP